MKIYLRTNLREFDMLYLKMCYLFLTHFQILRYIVFIKLNLEKNLNTHYTEVYMQIQIESKEVINNINKI